METKLLRGELEKDLQEAAQLLRDGKTVAFPTETVYGLGANALDADAVRKIYEAKGRPANNPLNVLIDDQAQLAELVDSVPETAQKLMDAFWPGPLTLIFKCRKHAVPVCVTGGLDTIGVRMPNHPVALRLMRMAGLLVAAPSANLSGKPSPTAASHVKDDLGGRIHAIVSGGSCAVGLESTILDISGEAPVILRPGAVTREQLEEVLGMELEEHPAETVLVQNPGEKYSHYTPEAPVYVCGGTPEEIAAKIDRELELHQGRAGVMLSKQTLRLLQNADENLTVNLGSRDDLEQISGNLFAALRYFDQTEVEAIYTENFPEEKIGAALMNRLNKAANHKKL